MNSISALDAVAVFTFDGCTNFTDHSSNRHQVVRGDVSFDDGILGEPSGSIAFSGDRASDLSIASGNSLDTTYSLTVVMNVYLEKSGPIINWGSEDGVGLYYDSGKLTFFMKERGEPFSFRDSMEVSNLKKKTWYHIAATYDYNTGKAFLYVGKLLEISIISES